MKLSLSLSFPLEKRKSSYLLKFSSTSLRDRLCDEEKRRMNNGVDTVNAAAVAIATAERRVQQVTSQRRRWGGCLSAYWCFGDAQNIRRIAHASFSSHDTTPVPMPGRAAPEFPPYVPNIVLPFVAPPSSPTSTEPPSVIHTPPGPLSLEACCSHGQAPMFTMGPYAYETQLVSPPVFSAFTTEPSTASRTPQEHDHNNQSLPEVPLSQLLLSSLDSNLVRKGYPRQLPSSHFVYSSSGASTPFANFESRSSSSNVTRQASRLNSMRVDNRKWSVGLAEEESTAHSVHCDEERPELDSADVSALETDPSDDHAAKRPEIDGADRHTTKCGSKLQSLEVLLNEAW